MTDRAKGLYVVLDQDIRTDDVEPTLNAIRQIKHVLAEEHHKNCHICQPGSTSTKVCNSAAQWEARLRA